MGRAGWTKKPCHGCGDPGPRPTDGLCSDCRRKLDRADRIVQAHEERKARGVFRYNVTASHWNPGFYSAAYDLPSARRDELRRALHDVLVLSGEPTGVPYGTPTGQEPIERLLEGCGNNHHEHTDEGLIIQPELVHAFRRLFHAIEGAISGAYADGKEQGASLLRGLAADEITLPEFTSRVVGGRDR